MHSEDVVMCNVLLVTCNSDATAASLRDAASEAIHVVKQFHQDARVRERHLFDGAIPLLDLSTIEALKTCPTRRSAKQWKTAAVTDMLLYEARSADVLVIAVPLVGGCIPRELSHWVEHICLAGDAMPDNRTPAERSAQNKIAIVVIDSADPEHDRSVGSDQLVQYDKLGEQLRAIGVTESAHVRSDAHHIHLSQAARRLIATNS